MKNKIYILLVFSILFYNCSDTKEEKFLKNFIDKDKVTSNFNHKKEISNDDLYILNKSEAINEYIPYDMVYYYGNKEKISEDSYLIVYGCQYHIDNNYHAFAPIGLATKSYLCIYQKGVGVVSKLKVVSNDPDWVFYEKKKDTYVIKLIRSFLKYDELKNGYYPYTDKDTIFYKYKIENNRFVKIK